MQGDAPGTALTSKRPDTALARPGVVPEDRALGEQLGDGISCPPLAPD